MGRASATSDTGQPVRRMNRHGAHLMAGWPPPSAQRPVTINIVQARPKCNPVAPQSTAERNIAPDGSGLIFCIGADEMCMGWALKIEHREI